MNEKVNEKIKEQMSFGWIYQWDVSLEIIDILNE